nr:sterile alpha motif domain-containing protein 1-like [Desmodus rotundus]
MGERRGEPRCPPLPSPRQRRARPSLASPLRAPPALHPPGLAWPRRPRRPTPSRAGYGTGRGRDGRRGGLLSPPQRRPQRWAAEARSPPPQLPHTPSRPSLPAGHSGKEEAARADPARRQLSPPPWDNWVFNIKLEFGIVKRRFKNLTN